MPPAQAPSRRGEAESGTSARMTERRTITIRGQVAPAPRPYESTAARRRPPRRASERIAGSRPDRAALWALLMGVFLILVAVMTAH
jgi:hypothetical protein